MPDHFFSLIKFVNFLNDSSENYKMNLIAAPNKDKNCYFGFK